jgi:hypothetical protein
MLQVIITLMVPNIMYQSHARLRFNPPYSTRGKQVLPD